MWEAIKNDPIHSSLDVAGFIPVLGMAADGVNAVIYLVEGNKVSALLSSVAIISSGIVIGAKAVVRFTKGTNKVTGIYALTDEYVAQMDRVLGGAHAKLNVGTEEWVRLQSNLFGLTEKHGAAGMQALIDLSKNMDEVSFLRVADKINGLENSGVFISDLATPDFATFIRNFGEEGVDVWGKMSRLGADDAIRRNPGALDALSKPKFDRPNPSTYLGANYISNHLQKFKGGVTKIVAELPSNGVIGPPTRGTFVIPKSLADDLISRSGGDISKLEDLLGLKRGTLGPSPFRVDIDSPSGVRMPDGNEFGANENWIPGGKTSGGMLEATVDQIQIGTYKASLIF